MWFYNTWRKSCAWNEYVYHNMCYETANFLMRLKVKQLWERRTSSLAHSVYQVYTLQLRQIAISYAVSG